MDTIDIVVYSASTALAACCLIGHTKVKEATSEVFIDHLSGLYNRKILNRLETLDKSSIFSVVSLDIDHFKKVNDTYGHNVGDMVIKTVAATILSNFKSKIDYCVRMGGEEFCIFFATSKTTDLQFMQDKCEALRKSIEEVVIVESGVLIKITASIGAILYDDKLSLQERIKLSDECMYNAKQTGRNKVVVK